jgi:hypothetical protein
MWDYFLASTLTLMEPFIPTGTSLHPALLPPRPSVNLTGTAILSQADVARLDRQRLGYLPLSAVTRTTNRSNYDDNDYYTNCHEEGQQQPC